MRLLRLWEGLQVTVRIGNGAGIELAQVWGILGDRSTLEPQHLEFGLDDPDHPTAVFPLALDGPYRCEFGEDTVTIATGDGLVLLVTLDRLAPPGLTESDHHA